MAGSPSKRKYLHKKLNRRITLSVSKYYKLAKESNFCYEYKLQFQNHRQEIYALVFWEIWTSDYSKTFKIDWLANLSENNLRFTICKTVISNPGLVPQAVK